MRLRTVILILLIALLAGIAWLLTRPGDVPDAVTDVDEVHARATRTTDGPAVPRRPRVSRERRGAAPVEPEAEIPIPPPVDLAKANRDLDLFGVVVNESDRPVAGADIRTFHFDETRPVLWDPDRLFRDLPGPRTRSAEDGTFSIRLERDRIVDLQVTAEGYAKTTLTMANAGESVRVVLPSAARLELTVVDEGGAGVEGADIRLWLIYGEFSFQSYDEERRGTTDSTGRIVIDDLHSATAWVQVRHGDVGTTVEDVKLEAGVMTEKEVILGTGRTVQGRVTDAETGEPIPGAKMRLWFGTDALAIADAEGRYEIAGVGGDFGFQLTAEAPGYASEVKPIPADGDLDFDLMRGVTAFGTVIDMSAEPIGGVLVFASGMDWEGGTTEVDLLEARTRADGTFTLEGLHPTIAQVVSFQKRGYGRETIRLDHELGIGAELDLGLVVLPDPRRIEGRALTEDDLPLPRVSVAISRLYESKEEKDETFVEDILGAQGSCRTDDLGRFRFAGLAAGTYKLLLHVGGRPTVDEVVTLPADSDLLDVEIRAPSGRSVVVRVEDDFGQPISGAYVTVWSTEMRNALPALTDADGRVTLDGLPDSEVTLSAYVLKGYVITQPKQVVPRGQEVRFVLKRASEITGFVKGPDGKPLRGLIVRGSTGEGGEENIFGFSNPDGSFTLQCPPGSIVDITVAGNPMQVLGGGETQDDSKGTYYEGVLKGVPVPSEGVEVWVKPSAFDGTVTVLVLDPDGNPAPGVAVRAYHAASGRTPPQITTGADGRAELTGLPRSQITISAYHGYRTGPLKDAVTSVFEQVTPEGQEVILQFTVGLAIEGVVIDEEGQPILGAGVVARSGQGAAVSTGTQADGSFRLMVPDEGPYVIEASRYGEGGVTGSGSVADVIAPSSGITITIQ